MVFGWYRRAPTPLTPDDRALAHANLPLLGALDDARTERLFGLAAEFLRDKQLLGGGDFEVTREVAVTIAVQACLLLLGRPDGPVYPDLTTLVIHPNAYVTQQSRHGPGGLTTTGTVARSGESWANGLLVLSWDHTLHGAVDPDDGHNVVLHEFAHQLDTADGVADGAPLLAHRGRYGPWARVLGAAYARLGEAVEAGRSSVLRPYGATEPAEFFAVATEAFFEKGAALRRQEPELYRELATFYGLDPAGWEVAG